MPEPWQIRPAPREMAELLLSPAAIDPRRGRAEERSRFYHVQAAGVPTDRSRL